MSKKSKSNFTINTMGRIGLLIFALIFALAFLTNGMGIIGRGIDQIISFVLGWSKYVLVVLMILLAINSFIKTIKTKDINLLISGLVILIISTMFFDLLSPRPGVFKNRFYLTDIKPGVNGGISGAFLNFLLLDLLGPLGLYILMGLAFLIALKIFFDLDYIKILKNLKNLIGSLIRSISNLFKNIYERIKKSSKSPKKEIQEKTQSKKPSLDSKAKKESQNLEKEPKIISSYEIFPDKKIQEKPIKKESPVTVKEKEELEGEIRELTADDYQAPPLSLLKKNRDRSKMDKKALLENSKIIEDTMTNFKIEAKVTNVTAGPTVTRYELVPAPDVRLNKIVNLSDNLAFSLASSDIRIEAPIPGKAAVGIEVPNKETSLVTIEEVINSREFRDFAGDLPLVLGRDVSGQIVIDDIEKLPHLLIAGATGSGKSVSINTIILSLIYKSSPRDLRLILIDPKIVELSGYNRLPHLLIPVVTDPRKAASTLAWAVEEMERRYKKFSQTGVRDIKEYNRKFAGTDQVYAKIVVIIDELADLMMVASSEVEDYISRLAQMARAAGIHLILATQRPSVDVITGIIKANIPSRISFAVSSAVDSRTILDESGAETLLGNGDMLFYPASYSKPRRIQGAFVSQEEIDNVLDYFKDQDYEVDDPGQEIVEEIKKVEDQRKEALETDPLFKDALKLVVYDQQASISYLQRKLKIGYNRAARMVDQMEEAGYIGPSNGPKPRDIYISEEEYLQILGED